MTDPFAPTPLNTEHAYGDTSGEMILNTEILNAATDGHVKNMQFETEESKKFGWFFWVCVSWIGLNFFVALFANILPLQDPNYFDVNNQATTSYLPPSLAHWFGTDDNGRDIFSRVIFGSRVSLEVGIGSMIIAFAIGGTLGMIAAYKRGKFDLGTSSVMYTILAFPAIVFVIAVLSFWQPQSMTKIILVLAVAAIPLVYRVIRAATLSAATREYVTIAQVQGASDRRIMFRELLPNIAPTALSFLLIGIASIIALEGGLAFLGLSVQNPTPSWGNMINESRTGINASPSTVWLAFFPSMAIVLFLLSLNFVGDRLRDHFDVAEVKL